MDHERHFNLHFSNFICTSYWRIVDIFEPTLKIRKDIQMASKVIHFHSFPTTLVNRKDAPFPNDSNEPNYVPGKFRPSEQFEFSRARPTRFFTDSAEFRSKQRKSLARARAGKGEKSARSPSFNFEGLACGNEEALRGQVCLKSFVIPFRFITIKS